MRILLLEDKKDIAAGIAEYLQLQGYICDLVFESWAGLQLESSGAGYRRWRRRPFPAVIQLRKARQSRCYTAMPVIEWVYSGRGRIDMTNNQPTRLLRKIASAMGSRLPSKK